MEVWLCYFVRCGVMIIEIGGALFFSECMVKSNVILTPLGFGVFSSKHLMWQGHF